MEPGVNFTQEERSISAINPPAGSYEGEGVARKTRRGERYYMSGRDPEPVPKTQPASSGVPPGPPNKTARGLGDGSPDPTTLPIRRAALLILSSAVRERATEMTMGPTTERWTSIRYRIDGTWHDWSKAGIEWPLMLSELEGLAGVRRAPYPKEGIIYVAYSGVRIRWQINVTSRDKSCFLSNLGSETV